MPVNTIIKNEQDMHIERGQDMIATWNNDSIVAAFNTRIEAEEAVKELLCWF